MNTAPVTHSPHVDRLRTLSRLLLLLPLAAALTGCVGQFNSMPSVEVGETVKVPIGSLSGSVYGGQSPILAVARLPHEGDHHRLRSPRAVAAGRRRKHHRRYHRPRHAHQPRLLRHHRQHRQLQHHRRLQLHLQQPPRPRSPTSSTSSRSAATLPSSPARPRAVASPIRSSALPPCWASARRTALSLATCSTSS